MIILLIIIFLNKVKCSCVGLFTIYFVQEEEEHITNIFGNFCGGLSAAVSNKEKKGEMKDL